MADKKGNEHVVIPILDSEVAVESREDLTRCSVASFPDFEVKESQSSRPTIPQSVVESSPSHEIARMSPLKPPVESEVWLSKPESRLVESPCPACASLAEEKAQAKSTSGSPFYSSPKITAATSPGEALKSAPTTDKTSVREEDDIDYEEDYKNAEETVKERSRKKSKIPILIEFAAFLCITGCLIASLTIDKLLTKEIWGLGLWKWCVLVLVIFCGRLFSQWFIKCLVFLFERNFLFQEKVLYFVYGLRKSVIFFIWLALVLLAWVLLFDQSSNRSKKDKEILNYVTRALGGSLIGAGLWLVKTLLVKIIAASFQCARFFERIKDSFFDNYILHTLSRPPPKSMADKVRRVASRGHLCFKLSKKERNGGNEGKKKVIDVQKLRKMKQGDISAWTMSELIDDIRNSGPCTIYDTIENCQEEINCELKAKAAASRIFRNIAKSRKKTASFGFINDEDLSHFLPEEIVHKLLKLFKGAVESRKIEKETLNNWLVKVYDNRKSLIQSLNDTKTAIEELNRLASAFVLFVTIIGWLLMMGFLTTKVLVFISSQLLLAGFMFGNTVKTVFEAIIFVFVMHPFDVGDRCVVDDVQLIVEEMNLLTTIFLRYDNEKIFYPNSVLATKPISNFYRSPPEMGDLVEFSIHFSTSIETIEFLKERIKSYLESKPGIWRPTHSVVVKDIENVNDMKMALYVNHTMNFQEYGEKNKRRSELVLELKKIFETLGIKYRLLPQEVQLNHVSSSAPPSWK